VTPVRGHHKGDSMKYRLYSINDRVAGEFGPVFQAVNDGVAIRNYKNLLKEAQSVEDYSLFYLGTFDTQTGDMVAEMKYQVVMKNE